MSFTMFKEDQRPVIRTSARITRAEFLASEDHVAGSLVKSDTSADKTFLFACAEGVDGDTSQSESPDNGHQRQETWSLFLVWRL